MPGGKHVRYFNSGYAERLAEAEALVRSGPIEMAEMREFGAALRVVLAEYDRPA